jgi:hypothetical protein
MAAPLALRSMLHLGAGSHMTRWPRMSRYAKSPMRAAYALPACQLTGSGYRIQSVRRSRRPDNRKRSADSPYRSWARSICNSQSDRLQTSTQRLRQLSWRLLISSLEPPSEKTNSVTAAVRPKTGPRGWAQPAPWGENRCHEIWARTIAHPTPSPLDSRRDNRHGPALRIPASSPQVARNHTEVQGFGRLAPLRALHGAGPAGRATSVW